ncbi:hypothetical protein [Desulfobacter curvatus]|uniref:hypothetical protein n=1 Tax=Desulfobacter curvatus TaxID=2290 RepID=UPI000379A152|nr:hypothetical protein [Desulfobacter curvatus]
MTRNFASLSLARLYEKQGYIDDALEIYRAIDTNQNHDDEDILKAISRLELQKETADSKENVKEPGRDGLNSDPVQGRTNEAGMAHMLEVWLRLIVMRKRVDIFKTIKARL